jgi:hypothetical protein
MLCLMLALTMLWVSSANFRLHVVAPRPPRSSANNMARNSLPSLWSSVFIVASLSHGIFISIK